MFEHDLATTELPPLVFISHYIRMQELKLIAAEAFLDLASSDTYYTPPYYIFICANFKAERKADLQALFPPASLGHKVQVVLLSIQLHHLSKGRLCHGLHPRACPPTGGRSLQIRDQK